MELKVYKEQGEEVRLKLKEKPNGIDLVAVDKSGKPLTSGYILQITNNGTLRRHPCLDSDEETKCGFKTEKKGRIKLEEE